MIFVRPTDHVYPSMDEELLIKELVSHLTTRGFPIVERDRAWQGDSLTQSNRI